MSLLTWLATFYPEAAEDIADADVSDSALVRHSLRKWEGLRKENLKKHGLRLRLFNGEIEGEEGAFPIDASSCALCQRYLLPKNKCEGCPLYEVLEGVWCDADGHPYRIWRREGNPEPMIQALQEALSYTLQMEE